MKSMLWQTIDVSITGGGTLPHLSLIHKVFLPPVPKFHVALCNFEIGLVSILIISDQAFGQRVASLDPSICIKSLFHSIAISLFSGNATLQLRCYPTLPLSICAGQFQNCVNLHFNQSMYNDNLEMLLWYFRTLHSNHFYHCLQSNFLLFLWN